MRRGFIFNQNRCTGCNACIAACMLENRKDIQPRALFQINRIGSVTIPVINLSVACNHCERPECLYSCPAAVFYRDPRSDAILVNENKCLGCNYCTWNCPFSAPKPDPKKRIISKCDLCNHLVSEGLEPACTAACPTGALKFNEIPDITDNGEYEWLPGKTLNPGLRITGKNYIKPLKIIPENIFHNDVYADGKDQKRISEEWSLIIFSFLSSVSAALVSSAAITGKPVQGMLIISIIAISGLISLFHLGRKSRAWRALLNITRSPLSREIFFYLIFAALSISAMAAGSALLLTGTALWGLVFLVSIDLVYTSADKRTGFALHSGQAFLTGLLMASFFSGMTLSFIFIAGIKILISLGYIIKLKEYSAIAGIRFIRISLLSFTVFYQVRLLPLGDPLIICLFIAGEFIDRILYYYDFNPVNLKTSLIVFINSFSNEKKGD